MRFIFLFINLCLTSLVLAEAKQDLTDKLVRIKSVKSDFTQQVFDERGKLLQKASGVFFLKKPNQFRWQTDEPFKQIISTQAQEVWLYDVNLAQITVHSLTDILQGTPAAILLKPEKAFDDYLIKKVAAQSGHDVFQLTETQDNPNASLDKITLEFQANSPKRMVLFDKLGRRTEIAFNNLQLNPVLLDSLFKISYPKHTDILR